MGFVMGIVWKDMSVSNLCIGQLIMYVIGWVKECLDKMMFEGYEVIIYVILIDDYFWVQVFVVIEVLLIFYDFVMSG